MICISSQPQSVPRQPMTSSQPSWLIAVVSSPTWAKQCAGTKQAATALLELSNWALKHGEDKDQPIPEAFACWVRLWAHRSSSRHLEPNTPKGPEPSCGAFLSSPSSSMPGSSFTFASSHASITLSVKFPQTWYAPQPRSMINSRLLAYGSCYKSPRMGTYRKGVSSKHAFHSVRGA